LRLRELAMRRAAAHATLDRSQQTGGITVSKLGIVGGAHRGLALVVLAVAALTSTAPAVPQSYVENFDSYVAGSSICGQGGWQQYAGVPCPDARVSNVYSRTPPNSLSTELDADVNQDWGNTFTSGRWDIRVWTYVPSSMVDPQWAVFLSDYTPTCGGTGSCSWTAQAAFDPTVPELFAQAGPSLCTGATQFNLIAPLVFDAWALLAVEVDLDYDRAQVSYNGAPVGDPFAWSAAINQGAGNGPLVIDTIVLYANNNNVPGDRMYWDDVTVQPSLGTPASCAGNITVYCTSGTSANACVPAIAGSGIPSASDTNGFWIDCTGVESNRSGILLYGFTDASFAPVPWAFGNTSYLCVKPPLQRTLLQNSAGGPSPCTGAFVVDWNDFMAANPAALGNPRACGQRFDAQYWYRDPPSPKTTNLSNALRFTLAP
jgi:hypothetical protein